MIEPGKRYERPEAANPAWAAQRLATAQGATDGKLLVRLELANGDSRVGRLKFVAQPPFEPHGLIALENRTVIEGDQVVALTLLPDAYPQVGLAPVRQWEESA